MIIFYNCYHILSLSFLLFLQFLVDICKEIIAFEGHSIASVEFALKFDPMQTKGMEEALHAVHAHQNSKRYPCVDGK